MSLWVSNPPSTPTGQTTYMWLAVAKKLSWLCPLLSLAVAGLLLWLLGMSPSTAALAGVLLGCPIAVAWVLVDAHWQSRRLNRGGHR